VPNLGSNDLSVIDTPTNTVAPTAITTFSGPLAAAARSDQSLVYVTNIGDNTVSVAETASNTVTAAVSVGMDLHIALSPDNSARLRGEPGQQRCYRDLHGKGDGPREGSGAIPAQAIGDGLDVDWT
jgi:YVTN family beta-propeller protein